MNVLSERKLRNTNKRCSNAMPLCCSREHYPFVWTSLEPYYNTYVARFLIDAVSIPILNFKLSVCDWTHIPWQTMQKQDHNATKFRFYRSHYDDEFILLLVFVKK